MLMSGMVSAMHWPGKPRVRSKCLFASHHALASAAAVLQAAVVGMPCSLFSLTDIALVISAYSGAESRLVRSSCRAGCDSAGRCASSMSSGRGRCARMASACCALRCATSQRSSPPASSSPAHTSARSWTRPTLPGAALPAPSLCWSHVIELPTHRCHSIVYEVVLDEKRTERQQGRRQG